MKYISKTVLTTLIVSALVLVAGLLLRPGPVYADAKADVCQGVGLLSGSNCSTSKDAPSPGSLVGTVVNILSALVAIIAVIMIIIGGIRFVLSGGDSNSTSSAQKTVIYALVGLVVAFMAQILVKFVLSKVQP